MKKNTITILFICILCIRLNAQDANFSQFFSSPLTLNPANTGNFNGSIRFAGNYRNQWASFNNAFSTATFSIDAPILMNKISSQNRLALGLLALSDQSGNGLLKQNYLSASIAYKNGFDQDAQHSLTLGFQTTYGSSNFNSSLAKFEDQLTPSGFLLSTSEPLQIANTSKNFSDINLGGVYAASNDNDRYLYLGFSINHLLEPKTSTLNTDYYLKRRYNINGGGYFPMGINTTLHTSFQYQMQADYHELIIGAALSYFINSSSNKSYELYLGTWLRNKDAFIPYLGFELNQLRFGFSYDINYSTNRTGGQYYRTGEFSIIQVFNKNSKGMINCPKF